MILTYDFRYVSLLSMTHDRTIRVRQKLLSHLPVTGEILRGSLLERTVRRRERVDEVRRWLSNYHKLKNAIEAICELNHDLLRPQATAAKSRGKSRD